MKLNNVLPDLKIDREKARREAELEDLTPDLSCDGGVILKDFMKPTQSDDG
jgi:hypothetical protein